MVRLHHAARSAMLLSLSLAAAGCLRNPAAPPPKYMNTEDTFEMLDVQTTTEPVATFVLEGEPYCFGGANNYYLIYKSEKMVADVLDNARKMGLEVIRTWGFISAGAMDQSVRAMDAEFDPTGRKDGIYFQHWDPATGQVAVNEGADGLEKLDYVLAAARKRGLRVILPFTGNWHEFGGIDQYLVYFGLQHHHEFFTSDLAKQGFKDYIKAVVTRRNSVDGTLYRDDPAIFSWELANEPRCMNGSEFDSLEGWDMRTLVDWVAEMSAYIKELDANHMVAIGDEGFLRNEVNHWTYNGHEGVDHVAMTAVETIDFATFHLYPDDWGTGYKHGYEWIEAHIEAARALGKPTVLEEYGAMVRRDEATGEVIWGWERRKTAYTNWHNILFHKGGNGFVFWMLAGYDDEKGVYPDYDHYTVYRGEPSGDLIEEAAARFKKEAPACRMAREWLGDVPKSPFVSVARPPERASPTRRPR